jgi:G:T-mismatch repair DNA endonuclease (very short patch repair protein)
MINKIFIDNDLWVDQQKQGKFVFVYLKSGKKLHKTQLDKIKIECTKCHKLVDLFFYNGLLNKKYICSKCRLSGENNPFYGKKHSKEFKERLSKERKGKWCLGKDNPMYGKNIKDYMTVEEYEDWKNKISISTSGEKNHFYGKTHTKETIDKIKRGLQVFNENRTEYYEQHISRALSESQKRLKNQDPEKYKQMKSKACRIAHASKNFYKINNLEKLIDIWLTNNNIPHEYSHIETDYETFSHQYDFRILNTNILVEAQGTYWHADPRFYKPEDLTLQQKTNLKSDIEKLKYAIDHGYKVLYIWEYDAENNNFDSLKELLDDRIYRNN